MVGGVDRAADAAAPVVVYLVPGSDLPPGRRWSEPRVLEVTIRDGVMGSDVPIVEPGQPISFRNDDRLHHELFSLDGRNAFELRVAAGPSMDDMPRAESAAEVVFEAEGPLAVFCKLHPDERHWMLVSAPRRHRPLAGDSRFEFHDVPPGRYRLGAISPVEQSQELELHLGANERVELRLRMRAR